MADNRGPAGRAPGSPIALTTRRSRFQWVRNAALATVLLSGCAVPIPPTGGPVDRDPPRILESQPADGAVNVTTARVEIRFDEYLGVRTVAAAVRVTPESERPPRVTVRGRSVRIEFPQALRPNTTYIISFEQSLQDAHGVPLAAPLTLAFSTGPTINSGRLAGRMVRATDGRPVQGMDIYAYRLEGTLPPDSLPTFPDYRTQTDSEGVFRLTYLEQAPFFVLGLSDANRNRRIDPGEAFAVPPVPIVVPDSAGSRLPEPWISVLPDTTAPELRLAAALSSSRLSARFSEPIRLSSIRPEDWSIEDSARTVAVRVDQVYLPSEDDRIVILRTDSLSEGLYRLRPSIAVQDTVFNGIRSSEVTFLASSLPDTARVRFLGFSGDSLEVTASSTWVLPPYASPRIRLSESLPRDVLLAAVSVTDSAHAEVPFGLSTTNGRTFAVDPQQPWPAGGVSVGLSLAPFGQPDSITARSFDRAGPRLLGEIAGVAVSPDSARVVVELIPASAAGEPVRRQSIDPPGRFQFDSLPGGRRYRLRIISDRNGDGEWTPGSLFPYVPPEALRWAAPPDAVRARWETILPDTLRFSPRADG